MKRFISILTFAFFVSTVLAAQEPAPKPDATTYRDYRSQVFQVVHHSPKAIASSVQLLGSGYGHARITVNDEMRTITVRDFPENLATIEAAIKRLDQPVAHGPDIQFKVSVLIGSRAPLPGATVPEELASVVRQLQSTLTYSHYGLLTTTLHRTRDGIGVDGSGVAEPTLLGMTIQPEESVTYRYRLRRVTASAQSVDIETFQFSMQIPIGRADGTTQHQSVGFETPVSLRPNEKVVIGTTTMGDKALIVVVTASVDERP